MSKILEIVTSNCQKCQPTIKKTHELVTAIANSQKYDITGRLDVLGRNCFSHDKRIKNLIDEIAKLKNAVNNNKNQSKKLSGDIDKLRNSLVVRFCQSLPDKDGIMDMSD